MRKTGQPTINDVARIAGVSKKTVSRVINHSPLLNGATRGRVEAAIAELGYTPNPQARALALRRSYLIGLVHDNPNGQTVLYVQQGMLEGLNGTEFELVIRPLQRGSPTLLDDFRHFLERQPLYGVIILPPISEEDEIARCCVELGCRYVRMGSATFDADEHMVTSNDREAMRQATGYLIEQGHRRIGLVAGPSGFRSALERRLGFEEALRAARIALPRSMIAEGNYTFESGIAAADRLLDAMPRPTAILSSNDEMAAGVMHSARQRGLDIPRDLSIVGFDDTPIAARVWPPLTTVRWPIASMARSAALKLIADVVPGAGTVPEPSLFLSSLVRRASVAPPLPG